MACGATWQECHYGVKMVYQRQPAQSGDVAFDSAAAERGSAGLDSQGCRDITSFYDLCRNNALVTTIFAHTHL